YRGGVIRPHRRRLAPAPAPVPTVPAVAAARDVARDDAPGDPERVETLGEHRVLRVALAFLGVDVEARLHRVVVLVESRAHAIEARPRPPLAPSPGTAARGGPVHARPTAHRPAGAA